MSHIRIAVLAGLFCCSPKFLQAVETAPGAARYRFDNWKVEQGLPQNTVQAVRQTRDGYLWIATRFGLGRFDGVSFKHFNFANTPAMISDNCTSLMEDADGTLWIGTEQGLLCWRQRTFTRFTTKDGLSHDYVVSLSASRDGGLWIGTRAGLCRLTGGVITNLAGFAEPGNRFVNCVLEDRQGQVWFDSTNGVIRLNPATGSTEFIMKADPGNGVGRWSLYEDKAGRIWIGVRNGAEVALYQWKEGRLTDISKPKAEQSTEMPGDGSVLVFETHDGQLWVYLPGTGGLRQLKDGQLLQFPLPDALKKYSLRCFWEDREHNLWIGTALGGLLRIQPRHIRTYTRDDGLPYADIWSVCEGADGSIWAGSFDRFVRIKDDKVMPFSLPGDLAGEIKCLLEDRAGNLWVGRQPGAQSSNAGLYCVSGQAITNRAVKLGIAAHSIRALYQDHNGRLWIGSSSGAYQFQEGRLAHYSTNDGLVLDNVRTFLQDRHGNVWMGTHGGGVSCWRDGKFIAALATTNGLAGDRVWALHEDKEGSLWIGTELGLNRYKDGRLVTFTRKEGLFDDLVNCILEDDAENLWISCNRGIYRVKRSELDAVAEGRARRVHHVAYGEGDGMESSETNGENQPAGWKARDGRLWFPTTAGLVVIDPKALQDNELPPPINIEQVFANNQLVFGDAFASGADERADGRRSAPVLGRSNSHVLEQVFANNQLVFGDALASGADERADGRRSAPVLGRSNPHVRLAPGRARVLEFHYTANSFVAPEKVAFRYRLEPYDSEWQEAGNRRVAYYTNLRPGNYSFRVQACNNHGYWNLLGPAFSFYLAPHFYQTWPFYSACVLAVVLLAACVQGYRLKLQRKLMELEQQHALDLERNRIARDMHDDLGADLTKIAILSEVAKKDLSDTRSTETRVEQISTIARSVVDNISELVWAANPRNDQLDTFASYLREYAAQFFDSTPIACQLDFQVPSLPLSAELRRNLFLAVKEALHNIVKHSGATQAAVSVSLQPQPVPAEARSRAPAPVLVITVADNGCGFDAANTSIAGNGLRNMRRRVAEGGGQFELRSQPGHGAQIRITLALPQ